MHRLSYNCSKPKPIKNSQVGGLRNFTLSIIIDQVSSMPSTYFYRLRLSCLVIFKFFGIQMFLLQGNTNIAPRRRQGNKMGGIPFKGRNIYPCNLMLHAGSRARA